MPEKKDSIDQLAQYPTMAKVHTAHPGVQLTRAAPLVLEETEEIAKFMSECSMWLAETTDDATMRKRPQLAVTIHVAYWLNKFNDRQRIEKWTETVEGLEEYVSQWRLTLDSSN